MYVVIFGGAGVGTALLLPTVGEQFGRAVASGPADAEALRSWAQGWSRSYQHSKLPPEVRQAIDRSVVQIGDSAVESARGLLVASAGLASYVPWLVLVPILAFFFLKDADGFRRAAILALPVAVRRRTYELFAEINSTLAAYIRAQLLACVVIGCTCGAGFALLDVPYPALLGVVAGVLEFVPLVGPLAAAILATTVAALHAPWAALWVLMFLASLRIIQDYVVYPRLIRHGIHLHPLAVIVAVLAGVELGGVAGIFVSIPLVAVVSVTWRHWFDWRANGEPFSAEARRRLRPRRRLRSGWRRPTSPSRSRPRRRPTPRAERHRNRLDFAGGTGAADGPLVPAAPGGCTPLFHGHLASVRARSAVQACVPFCTDRRPAWPLRWSQVRSPRRGGLAVGPRSLAVVQSDLPATR